MVRRFNNYVNTALRASRYIVVIVQGILILCSLVFAWLLQFNFQPTYVELLLKTAPILVLTRLAVMPFFNLMHGWWRYTGASDAVDVLKAVLTGSAIFFVLVRIVLGLKAVPLSLYFLEALLTFTVLAGVRLASRILAEKVWKTSNLKRLLLIGAGHAAQMIIRETQQVATGYLVVGCLDDDPLKKRIKVLGVPVLGSMDQLPAIMSRHEVDEVLIAIPSATSSQMRRFVKICEDAGATFRTVPGLAELLAGQATMQQVREVRLQDLLGREPVKLDLASVRAQLQGRVVMVTGAAGSIGSELCRQILRYGPSRLLCVDQNETGIFYLQRELSKDERALFFVADVGDTERMRKLFPKYKVQIVFHAAAYKHVPVMEANIEEAVNNNVFKLLSLLEVAQSAGSASFVMISSDKAVNPTSVMGCTKRIGELILAAWPANGLRCVSVRFGNVLGSSGSVVPLFQEQIRQKSPITITHPEITRFFMTIPEAVSLVLQAFAVGQHGNTLVLDMGSPIRIFDLATTLIRLSGSSVKDVEIKFTGLRPGEKLSEELFYEDERIVPTACDKVKCTQSPVLSWAELTRHLDALQDALSRDGSASIRARLRAIVPEFACADFDHPDSVNAKRLSPKTVEAAQEKAQEKPKLRAVPAWDFAIPQGTVGRAGLSDVSSD